MVRVGSAHIASHSQYAGDLGVQRGVIRWFLSLHSPQHPYAISPKKLPKAPGDDDTAMAEASPSTIPASVAAPPRATTPDASSVPPGPVPSTPVRGDGVADAIPAPPPAFTPSINRTLNKVLPSEYVAPALPQGLTVQELKSRLDGKKKIKCVYLPFA